MFVYMCLFLNGMFVLSVFVCARYDPEVFPGLTYRIKEPDVVLLVFARFVCVFVYACPV